MMATLYKVIPEKSHESCYCCRLKL